MSNVHYELERKKSPIFDNSATYFSDYLDKNSKITDTNPE